MKPLLLSFSPSLLLSFSPSLLLSAGWLMFGAPLAAQVATPEITPKTLDSAVGIQIQIDCATPGATIRYTLNGSEPTDFDQSIPSGGTLQVARSTVVKAAAWLEEERSATATEDYRITGEVASGNQHGVAISVSGKAWTWGQQQYGRLGNGYATAALQVDPIEVLAANGTDAFETGHAVAAGHQHTLIITDGGKVAGFGRNAFGSLGNNSNSDAALPVLALKSATPGDYLADCVGIAAGEHFSLAVDSTGDVFSWGLQSGGRLGNGTTLGTQLFAQPVRKDLAGYPVLDGAAAVAAGAISGYALEPNSGAGKVWAWGGNANGQLGQGSTAVTLRAKPVKLSSSVELTDGWSIAAGEAHLAIVRWHPTDPDLQGSVWTCGARASGRLGQGSTAAGSVTYPARVMIDATTPLDGIVQVSAGAAHTLALDEDGSVWAWGYNGYGQLGNGSTTQSGYAVKVRNATNDGDLEDIVAISAGGDGIQGASMAVAENGTIYVWGRNNQGQLGNGTTSLFATPLPIAQAQNHINEGAPALALACEMLQPEAAGCFRLTAIPTHSGTAAIESVTVFMNGEELMSLSGAELDDPANFVELVDGLAAGTCHLYGIIEDENGLQAMAAAETVVTFPPDALEVVGLNGTLTHEQTPLAPEVVESVDYRLDVNESVMKLSADFGGAGAVTATATWLDGSTVTPVSGVTSLLQPDGSYTVTIDPTGTTGPLFVALSVGGDPAWFRQITPVVTQFTVSQPLAVSGTTNRSFATTYGPGEYLPILKSEGGNYKFRGTYDVSRGGTTENGDYRMVLRGLPDQQAQTLPAGDTLEDFTFQIPTFALGGYDIRLDLVRVSPGEPDDGEVVVTVPVSPGQATGSGFGNSSRWTHHHDSDETEFDNGCSRCGRGSGTETVSYIESEGSVCASGYLTADSTSDSKVDASFGLGTTSAGAGGGRARIRTNDLSDPAVATPQALTLDATESVTITAHASGDYPSSIVTKTGTTTLTAIGPDTYTLSFAGAAGTGETTALTVVRETKSAQEWWLRLIEKRFGGTVVETRYEQVKHADGSETWTIREGAPGSTTQPVPSSAFLRATVIEKSPIRVVSYPPLLSSFSAPVPLWTETVTQSEKQADDGDWEDVKVTENTFRRFSWGSPLIKQVRDPADRSLTTQWDYVTQRSDYPAWADTASLPANAGSRRGLLAGFNDYRNFWQRFAYDGEGRLEKVSGPFQSSSSSSAATTGDVWSFTYAAAERRETRRMANVIVTENLVTGSPVDPAGTTRYLHRLATPGSGGSGPGDLTTMVVRAPVATAMNFTGFAPDSYRVTRTERSDGTLETCTWTIVGTQRIKECRDGNAALSRGAMTKSWFDCTGNLEKIETWTLDFNGQPSNPKLLTTVTRTNPDALSRLLTTTTTFGAGNAGGNAQVEEIAYSCCGLALSTDYRGLKTRFTYDHLKRRVTTTSRETISNPTGLTLTTNYNGRTVETVRSSGSGPAIVTGQVVHKLSGELEFRSSASPLEHDGESLVTTTYAYTYAANSYTETETRPDNGTVETVRFLDGRLCLKQGTATDTMGYNWSPNPGIAMVNGGVLTLKTIYGSTSFSASQWTRVGYDLLGREVELHYPGGHYATTHYLGGTGTIPGKGLVQARIDPDGVTTLYGYNDEAQQTLTAADLNGNQAIDLATDRITWSQTDAGDGPGSSHAWISETRVLRAGDASPAAGLPLQRSFRRIDGLATWSDPFGDANRRTTETTTLSGDGDWETKQTEPDGRTTTSDYADGLLDSRVTQGGTSGPVISSVTYGYDAHDRLETATDARTGVTRYTYKNSDQPQSVTLERGAAADLATTYTYDEMGRTLIVDSPDTAYENKVTRTYDKRGNLQTVRGDQVYDVDYSYDSLSRLTTQTTYRSGSQPQVTKWHYDTARGWLVEKQHPGENDTSTSDPDYTYTPAGRLRTRAWERGVTTTYTYDFDGAPTGFGLNAKAGDLASVSYNDGATAPISHTYKRWGASATITDITGTRVFEYRETIDLALLSEQGSTGAVPGGGVTIPKISHYDYDAPLARFAGFRFGAPGGTIDHAVQYGYEAQTGRLATVTHGDTAHSIPERHFTMGYLENSNLLESLDGITNDVQYAWESHRDILKSTTSKQGTGSGIWFKVRYGGSDQDADAANGIGQRESAHYSGLLYPAAGSTARDGSSEFSYNAKGELDSEVRKNGAGAPYPGESFGYAYDDIGNRKEATIDGTIAATYLPNDLNQYDSIDTGGGAVSRVYDADGNLTDDGTRIYGWDAENRLISVRSKSDNALIAEYLYDYMSRRIWKKASINQQVATESVFLYQGWNLVGEYPASGKAIAATTVARRTYTWGLDLSGSLQGAGGVGGLLAIEEKSGPHIGVHYPHYDGNGNVLATSKGSSSSGFVTSCYEYNGFGETVVATKSYKDENPFRFSTKYFDRETGFYYYGYRYYDPVTGRWPSRDPIGEQGGYNLYGFVGNDGVGQWDYLGLLELPDWLNRNVEVNAGKFVSGVWEAFRQSNRTISYFDDNNCCVVIKEHKIEEGLVEEETSVLYFNPPPSLADATLEALIEQLASEALGQAQRNAILKTIGFAANVLGSALEKANLDGLNINETTLILDSSSRLTNFTPSPPKEWEQISRNVYKHLTKEDCEALRSSSETIVKTKKVF